MSQWHPRATRYDGPAAKQGYGSANTRISKGVVVHSAEGPLTAMVSVLENPGRQASWHFSVGYLGQMIQHYPLSAMTWAAGGYANRRWVNIECEGRVGEPLTPAQVDAVVDIISWMDSVEQWGRFVLEKDTGTMHEHRWYMQTLCPSNRVPWPEIIGRLTIKPADACALWQMRVSWLDEMMAAVLGGDAADVKRRAERWAGL